MWTPETSARPPAPPESLAGADAASQVSCLSCPSSCSNTDGHSGSGECTSTGTGSTDTEMHDAPRTRIRVERSCVARASRTRNARLLVEGRLRDVHLRIEHGNATTVIAADARCHGSSIRRRTALGDMCGEESADETQLKWHDRSVELARRMMREMLSAVRASVEEIIMEMAEASPGSCEARCEGGSVDAFYRPETSCAGVHAGLGGRWEACASALDETVRDYDGGDDGRGEVVDDGEGGPDGECYEGDDDLLDRHDEVEQPGVRVVDIEWANQMRWGGDAQYNSKVDGDIVLQGFCVIGDPSVNRNRLWTPAWEARWPPKQEWHATPKSELLNAIATRLSLSQTIGVNTWALDRVPWIWPIDDQGTDELASVGFSNILAMRTRATLVRIYGPRRPDRR